MPLRCSTGRTNAGDTYTWCTGKKDTTMKRKPKLKIVDKYEEPDFSWIDKWEADNKEPSPFTTNYLEDLPDELSSAIYDFKKKSEDEDAAAAAKAAAELKITDPTYDLDQAARDKKRIKEKVKRIIMQEIESSDTTSPLDSKFHQLESDFINDYRHIDSVGNRDDEIYRFSEDFIEEMKTYGIKVKKSRMDTEDIVELSSGYFTKMVEFELRNILVQELNDKPEGAKLKTNSQIIKEYFTD
tara:strand:+ start:164 stop:886 length:723 start_codon:yes stop_codon:yes gene_type:complete